MAVFHTFYLFSLILIFWTKMAVAEELMLKRGMGEAQVEAGMAMQAKIMKPEIMAPFSIIGNMFWGLLISLIVGVFVRKESNPLLILRLFINTFQKKNGSICYHTRI
jgi:hypothetical protein